MPTTNNIQQQNEDVSVAASAKQVGASSTASNSNKGKYVPPHLRKKMMQQANSSNGNNDNNQRDRNIPATRAPPRNNSRWNRNDDQPSNYGRSDRREYGGNDRYSDNRSGGYNSRNDRNDSYGGGSRYSNNRSGGSRRGWSSGHNRWENFEDSRHNEDREEIFQEIRADSLAELEKEQTALQLDDKEAQQVFGKENTGINFDAYEDIDVDTSGNDCPPPMDDFYSLDLGDILLSNIKLAKYKKPTPVQKHSIPIVMQGRDLMACAQTGSGKTAAFLFPIISCLLYDGAPKVADVGTGYKRKAAPRVLIIAPTRELASQIFDEAKKFSYTSPVRPVVVYGGAEIRNQFRELEAGVDILVATPGRLVDLIERAKVTLSQVSYLILDEADRMLDMGFEPQVRRIVEEEDMPYEKQTLLFSATFPKDIQRLASDFLNDYIFLKVGRIGSTTENITQKIEYADDDVKKDFLVDLLTAVEGLTLIFVETKRSADQIEDFLCQRNFAAISIHGDRTQSEREYALRSFRSKKTPYLVATDVASRGLDIPGVAHVVNFDMPNDIDSYVHRIGRTGRAGKKGIATTFVNQKNRNVVRDLLEILHEANQTIPGFLEAMNQQSSYSRGRSGNGGSRRGRNNNSDFRNGTETRRWGGGGNNYRNNNNNRYHNNSGGAWE